MRPLIASWTGLNRCTAWTCEQPTRQSFLTPASMKSAKSVTGRGGKDLPVRNRVSVMSFTYLLLLDNRMLLFVNFRRFGSLWNVGCLLYFGMFLVSFPCWIFNFDMLIFAIIILATKTPIISWSDVWCYFRPITAARTFACWCFPRSSLKSGPAKSGRVT